MTATPIPRTLALTIYGDLDVSVIDEMPPGRKPISTKHVTEDRIESVYSFLKKQVDAGRQAYVVYPVIEESEAFEGGAKDAPASFRARVSGPARGAAAWPLEDRGAGKSDGRVSPRRGEDSGLDHGDRSGRGRSERYRDGDRAGRALRAGATAPIARARGAGRRTELLHPGYGENERRGARAHPHAWWTPATASTSRRWI